MSFILNSFKGDYENLLDTIQSNDIQKVKDILDKTTKNKEILNLNEKVKNGWYSLLLATNMDNIEIVKLLIDYAINNKIILKINEQDNDGDYPLLRATRKNNIKMVKLLIDYANVNNIILELKSIDRSGYFPIFWSINYNNIEMFKLLIDYSMEKGIKLIINENDIENLILKNDKDINLKSISDINNEFIKMIYLYKNQNIIELIFSENSYLLKKLNDFYENEKKRKREYRKGEN